MIAQKIDPGTGDADAPLGSEERAKFVRLKLATMVLDLPKTPERFAGWWNEITAVYPHPSKPEKKIHGWELLTNDTGKPFRSLDAFCQFRRPWGLGKKRAEVVAYLKAARVVPPKTIGGVKLELDAERSLALAGATDGRANNGSNRGDGGFETRSDSYQSDKNHGGVEAARLRAIARAPEQVGIAFEAGVVSKGVAVAAGVAAPAREQPELHQAVGQAVESVVRDHGAPKDDADKRALKKKVDAAVKPLVRPVPTLDVRPAPYSSGYALAGVRVWLDTESSPDERAAVHEASAPIATLTPRAAIEADEREIKRLMVGLPTDAFRRVVAWAVAHPRNA